MTINKCINNIIYKINYKRQLYMKPIFRISTKKNKKYDVYYNNKWISFGQLPYEHYKTSNKIPQELHIYEEHHDKERRNNYRKRASKITNKEGKYTYKNKNSPNYWSYFYLW
jgi:hypothetical protein